MNFKGTVTINAPREKVWAFLTDPTQLTECAPGLEKLDVIVRDDAGV
jgi:carbon monoxide dehydrogenase subunit G